MFLEELLPVDKLETYRKRDGMLFKFDDKNFFKINRK